MKLFIIILTTCPTFNIQVVTLVSMKTLPVLHQGNIPWRHSLKKTCPLEQPIKIYVDFDGNCVTEVRTTLPTTLVQQLASLPEHGLTPDYKTLTLISIVGIHNPSSFKQVRERLGFRSKESPSEWLEDQSSGTSTNVLSTTFLF